MASRKLSIQACEIVVLIFTYQLSEGIDVLQRHLFKGLLGLLGYPTTDGDAQGTANVRRIMLQTSPIAGFHFYHGGNVWSVMRVDDPLDVVRDADNVYDINAVRLDWQGSPLGYLPRTQNRAVANLLDQVHVIEASIVEKHADVLGKLGVEVAVYLVVDEG